MKHTRPSERSEGSGGNTALLKGGEVASKMWRKGEEREGEGHWRGRITKKASDTRPLPSHSGSLGVDLLLPSVSSFHDLFTTSECDLVYSYNVNKHILFSLNLSYIWLLFPQKWKWFSSPAVLNAKTNVLPKPKEPLSVKKKTRQ